MAGRKRSELSGTGPQADLARRLRALRDERGLTLRQLAAKSGYSQATLSGAEAGRRTPSWEVVAAFAQGCGDDAGRWRQLWELADSAPNTPPDLDASRPGDQPTTPGGQAQPGSDGHAAAPVVVAEARPGRTTRQVRRWAGAALACAAAVGLGTAFMTTGHATPPRASPTSPRAVAHTTIPVGAPSAPYPVRRYDTTTMHAGERITLDAPPGGDWPRATQGSVGYDLEFTLADRLLVSVGTQTTGASLALIPAPTNTYYDCKTSDYSGVVPTDAIATGTEFCVLTSQRRRALIVIRTVHRDSAGLPDQVTLTITTWEHIVPPGS